MAENGKDDAPPPKPLAIENVPENAKPLVVHVAGLINVDQMVLDHGILVTCPNMPPMRLSFRFEGDQMIYELQEYPTLHPEAANGFIFRNAREQKADKKKIIVPPKPGLII